MKAKLIVDDKEFEIEILDPKVQEFVVPKLKKTGYERLDNGALHIRVDGNGNVTAGYADNRSEIANAAYESANYYSDISVAENNARADKLMRKLRRFAVEHRENDFVWDTTQNKFYIYYSYTDDCLGVDYHQCTKDFCGIYFDTRQHADLAIETFHDELIWYFTEYKDSM